MSENAIILLILCIIFVVFTIILLSGKGAMLVAGYNTASEIEKRKYDPEKLSKSMGKLFLIMDILFLPVLILTILQIDNKYVHLGFGIAITIAVIIYVIWMNVSGEARNDKL